MIPDLVPVVAVLLAATGIGCGALGWLACWLTTTRPRRRPIAETPTAEADQIGPGASEADRLVRGEADAELAALAPYGNELFDLRDNTTSLTPPGAPQGARHQHPRGTT